MVVILWLRNNNVHGMSKTKKIIKALVDVFSLFMLQVAKKDDNIHPPTRSIFLLLIYFLSILFILVFSYLCYLSKLLHMFELTFFMLGFFSNFFSHPMATSKL
jgi:hypothetical protein